MPAVQLQNMSCKQILTFVTVAAALMAVKQQTPKPEAQFPDAVPPFSVHQNGSNIELYIFLRSVHYKYLKTSKGIERVSSLNLNTKAILFKSQCPKSKDILKVMELLLNDSIFCKPKKTLCQS